MKEKLLEKLKKLEYSSLYPLFFTVVFILILIQYSFFSLDAIFYDLWIRFDFIPKSSQEVVIVVMDEESDQFLGETYPYTYASHHRLIEKVIADAPKGMGYLVPLEVEPESVVEQRYVSEIRQLVQNFQRTQKGFFRFGTKFEMMFGEVLPVDELRSLGYSTAFLFQDTQVFSRDGVIRRASLNISGEDSFHLWIANKWRESQGRERREANSFLGSIYNAEADATFAMFKYRHSPLEEGNYQVIPYHRVVTGNYSEGFFKDKLVLVGARYISNGDDFALTPFNKDEARSSKLAVHANIIEAMANGSTVIPVPDFLTQTLSVLIAVILSFFISKVQPTKGLLITITLMLGTFAFGYLAFIGFGLWFKLSHMILGIFVVYYIWVPFRAIEEYQTRYAIQEEAKLLKQVDNLKQNFISLMSHDLKTPVAKIAGIADILRIQYPNVPQQKELLDNIVQATKELNSFITSILDLTKIESQNLTLRKESKDINKVIESIVDKLRFEAEAQEMHIALDLAPLYPIQVDSVLMNRVMSNLIENAIKYAGRKKSISVKTWDDAQWVYIEIKDDGVGIKPDDITHIFDKFYRVKNDSTHAIKGSGLGLYLVKYFIELHSGTIAAESQLGVGTTFTIKLKNE
ncbi:MAG: CHASE2 and HATPase_c domain-containing protein [Proteobacteria bacterium]|nr:CHASE2 and HATPase_c domain-containing protein [Pseudomonadota bacterium]